MSNKLVGHIYSPDAIHGKSAYELAVMHGFDGTEEEWIEYQITEAERKAQEIANKTLEEVEEVTTRTLEDVSAAKTAAMTEIDNRDRTLIANAIKNTAKGNVIVLNDVSPLEHTISVKARSTNGIVADLSAVQLHRYGGNILSVNSVQFPISSNKTIFEGKISGDFVLSWEDNLIDVKEPSAALFAWRYADGTFGNSKAYGSYKNEWNKINISGTVVKIEVANWVGASGGSLDKIQLAPGTEETPFEPYAEHTTHSINADGTVEGVVTSLYPTTTLIPDTEGVELDVEYNRDANKVIAELFALIQGRPSSIIGYIDLLSANWEGSASPYYQKVTIDGVTENSKVDINPSVEQLAIFHTKDIAFVAENVDGVVTVYCIGQKPTADYQMQITITEVDING